MEKNTDDKIVEPTKDNGGNARLRGLEDKMLEDIQEAREAPKGQEPIFLTKEERLEAENMQLRLMNLAMQEQQLLQNISQLRKDREDMQRQMIAHRDKIGKKYNIDFSKCEVRAGDGAIVPRDSTPPGLIR
jgi:hypothetical protein